MKTISSIEKITFKVTDSELIENKWIPYNLLSKKIADYEKEHSMAYKALRTKLYNSCACGKYNVEMKAGIKCINVEETMKSNSASLFLIFERG